MTITVARFKNRFVRIKHTKSVLPKMCLMVKNLPKLVTKIQVTVLAKLYLFLGVLVLWNTRVVLSTYQDKELV